MITVTPRARKALKVLAEKNDAAQLLLRIVNKGFG